MDIFKKETCLGTIYYSNKTKKFLLNQSNNEVIRDMSKISQLFMDNRVPFSVQFEITERCNFSCYYCYAKPLREQKDLKLEEIKHIIDRLDEIGVIFLELTGGEILSRKDFLDILKYINSKSFILSIFTNSSQLTDEIIEELKKSNIQQVSTSLLAPTKEKCDELTGVKGSFEKIIDGISKLRDAGFKLNINSPLTAQNIEMLDEYRELEKSLGVQIGTSLNLCATFNGYEEVKKYALTLNHVQKLREFYPSMVGNENIRIDNICSALKSKFAIDSCGNMLPCLKYRVNLGNILKNDIMEIWNSALSLETYKKIYEISDDCMKCEKAKYCKYCPGLIMYYENKDDYCFNAELIKNICKR